MGRAAPVQTGFSAHLIAYHLRSQVGRRVEELLDGGESEGEPKAHSGKVRLRMALAS